MQRVKKELSKQFKIRSEQKIVVACSGGKDSTVAMVILDNIYRKHKNVTLEALTIDEGIKGYRPDSIKFAKKAADQIGIPHRIISFKDRIGYDLDTIFSYIENTKSELLPCSYCGVFRRFCLNTEAKAMDATRLATGHNLDDIAQSIFMNIFRADIPKLARLGPHKRIQPGLVPRTMPLRVIPEKETYLYSILNGIEIYDGECPYAKFAQRGRFRNVLAKFEEDTPGTRHSLLSTYDQLSNLLIEKYSSFELNKCEKCSEPTSNLVCKSCKFKDLLDAYFENK
jgi:uncharacterized protein (TIGR00269 family)